MDKDKASGGEKPASRRGAPHSVHVPLTVEQYEWFKAHGKSIGAMGVGRVVAAFAVAHIDCVTSRPAA